MERGLALLAGLVFGIGLILAGMVDPAKVLGFLDLAGAWDPSLALVMGGAIAVGIPTFWLAKGRSTSACGNTMQIPTQSAITPRLIVGSVMFGAGWGLAGLCPGPALVTAATGNLSAIVFVAAMLTGFALFQVLETSRS